MSLVICTVKLHQQKAKVKFILVQRCGIKNPGIANITVADHCTLGYDWPKKCLSIENFNIKTTEIN